MVTSNWFYYTSHSVCPSNRGKVTLYINDSIPLGTEHYFLIAIITSLLLTVFYSVYYCYSEFFCFCKYDSELTLIDFENKANANYKLLLSVLKVSLILCLFTIFLSTPITEIKNYKIAIFIDVIIIIITVLALIKLFRNQSIQRITIPQFICCIGIWIVLGTFILLVGLGVLLNINKNSVNIVFSDEKDYPLKITQIKDSPES